MFLQQLPFKPVSHASKKKERDAAIKKLSGPIFSLSEALEEGGFWKRRKKETKTKYFIKYTEDPFTKWY